MTTLDIVEETKEASGLKRDPDWWRGAVIYQIYPRSFADSNGDGIGDIPGITERLPYIADLGVDAIWISPFMKSPMDDFGYDVSDYRQVDPMFGTLDDIKVLIDKAHELGLRVLMDQVISHTSDQHAWFTQSRQSKDNPKADWYVWADAKPDGTPPNNWLSVFGGSAWQWDTRRMQYYLHNFLRSQPDLNFHNAEVQDAVLEETRFWLDLGIDGFRLDTANFYFHDKELRDNPPLSPDMELSSARPNNPYSFQQHIYDKSRPENIAFLERLRALMEEYEDRTTVGEIGADDESAALIAQYTEQGTRLHMAYSFDLLVNEPTPDYIRSKVGKLERIVETGWPSWAMSNHDVVRTMSRLPEGTDKALAAPLLLAVNTCLRGSPCIYQGEELGFTEVDVPFEHLQDPYGIEFWPEFKGRDGCRTPMAWDDTANGGFSTATPWLPVAPEHIAMNAERQQREPSSALNRSSAFLKWRRQQTALVKGSSHFVDLDAGVLALTRSHEGQTILCVFNISSDAVTLPLPAPYTNWRHLSADGFASSHDGTSLMLSAWQAAFFIQPEDGKNG
ncbi:alpha-glucosidase [Rhodobacteraceae bacterium RKSG542]|uniref:alpha-glucosidase family protein n=1 Tax=Pseudovibrio flavus TaxID=2529854 RepID=UPI0012BBBC40|nr:alpha-glucosidase family protein [Pseudovibrio flavus]MTI17090.1 alpha-glucosidase [Pseudovibrio flavus]